MNKRVLFIIIIVVILVAIVSCGLKKENSIVNSSGEQTTKVVSNIDADAHDVPERFKDTVKEICSKYGFNNEDIKLDEELKSEFGLDSIGEYEGLLIKKTNPEDYNLIAIIIPKEVSDNANSQLLLNMIKKYESVKSSNPEQSYLREANNICMKQQGGVSIYILSKNASGIYDIINQTLFNL